jgi:hypothetical protein
MAGGAVFGICTSIHYASAKLTHRAAIFNKNFWPREETRLIQSAQRALNLRLSAGTPDRMARRKMCERPRNCILAQFRIAWLQGQAWKQGKIKERLSSVG